VNTGKTPRLTFFVPSCTAADCGFARVALTLRQEKLLGLLRERGPLAIREIAGALRVMSPGAHYALKPLLRNGVIRIIGARKSARYLLS
jgi:DNA-binding Lrp family transcriptional regulator